MSPSRLPENFKPLLGTEEAKLDEKGRLLFSKKKRERLGDDFTLLLGKVGCLIAYPKPIWEMLLEEIFAVGTMNPAREEYTRHLLAMAEDDLKFDEPGRIVVPQKLRTAAKLEGKLWVIGCVDRVEIWSQSEYDEFQKYPTEYGDKRRRAIEASYREMQGVGE